MRYQAFIGAAVMTLLTTTVATADTLHVNIDHMDCTDGPSGGTAMEPFCSIHVALSNAQTGDTVQVADGTYLENINFPTGNIVLTSEYGPSSTIIMGTGGASVISFLNTGNAVLNGFTITGGSGVGGGVFVSNTSPTISNNIIKLNSAAFGGGGIAVIQGDPLLINNVIVDNAANSYGGGVFFDQSEANMIGCTIANNNADSDGDGIFIVGEGYAKSFRNCIIYGNGDSGDNNEVYINTGTVTITYSAVEGGQSGISVDDPDHGGFIWGDGNLGVDPMFLDPDNADYHIHPCSPVVNAGDPGYDATGEKDIDGDSRKLGGRIDMGADEVDPNLCVADSDGDDVPDDMDYCPDSDLSPTIVIDGCHTEVYNEVSHSVEMSTNGCSRSDLIAACSESCGGNHGEYVSCVAALTNGWKQDGEITGQEKGRIQSCAAQADLWMSCQDNADCDDGVYCNGVEVCADGECVVGDPCPGQSCDEGANECCEP